MANPSTTSNPPSTITPTTSNGTAPSTPTPPGTGGSSSTEVKKPDESQGDFALRLVREQRRAGKAEQDAKAARDAEKTTRAELDALKGRLAGVDAAGKAWGEGKYVDALRSAFGLKGLPENLLVELASAETTQPEPVSPEQLREQIRAELKAEQEALRKVEAEEEAERTAKVQELRVAAVNEVAGTLTGAPEKWPTVWALGVTGDQIADKIDEQIKTGKAIDPPALFEALEQEYRERVLGAGYLAKPAPNAAPRSFGSEVRRGPTDTAPPDKGPSNATERWALRKQQDIEWRRKQFGGG